MNKRVPAFLRRLSLIAMLLIFSGKMYATHIFGADLFYTYVADSTYTVTLVIYGDCSSAVFSTLSSSVPEIDVYNGDDEFTSINLDIQDPISGVEVTPVCAGKADSTTCTDPSYTIPGITKFVYKGNVTLTGTSSVWRFQFSGVLISSSAGRSSSITNIESPGTSIIQLVDTLNNTTGTNSSAVYTTIPTPFFCLDIPANFNPGAVDPNSDSLAFYLVDGQDAAVGGPVTYISPYTAEAPLATSAGTFSFNGFTGQLSFTPNMIQRSLVVYNVEEYRAGVLVGTTQREMSCVVLGACTNVPPVGAITSATSGTLVDSTKLEVCSTSGPFTFHINPINTDSNTITITYAGLPAGATYTITNNNTLSPTSVFSWNTTGIVPGNYTFFITFQDNGCPLSSTQTIAYTIAVLPLPSVSFTQVSNTCTGKAIVSIAPGGGTPYTISLLQDGTTLQTFTAATAAITDSLAPGTYTIHSVNADSCTTDTTVTFTVPPPMAIVAADTINATCEGFADGAVTLHVTNGTPPYSYSQNGAPSITTNNFTGLLPNTYSYIITDNNGCVVDTSVTLTGYPHIILGNLSHTDPTCYGFANGSISFSASGGVAPLIYDINGTGPHPTGIFDSLGAGTYIIHITDSKGCTKDTAVDIHQADSLGVSYAVTPNDCEGNISGSVTVNVTGGTPPYVYTWSNGASPTTPALTDLTNGTYSVLISDADNCSSTVTANVIYDDCCKPFVPSAFTPNDDGKNDVFRMRFKGDIQLLEFSVYNRFGQQVFTTKDPDKGWDGTFAGNKQDLGTYFYYVKLICGNSGKNKLELKGDVLLIR